MSASQDPSLSKVFNEEARELIAGMRGGLSALRSGQQATSDKPQILQELVRCAHTLRRAARAKGRALPIQRSYSASAGASSVVLSFFDRRPNDAEPDSSTATNSTGCSALLKRREIGVHVSLPLDHHAYSARGWSPRFLFLRARSQRSHRKLTWSPGLSTARSDPGIWISSTRGRKAPLGLWPQGESAPTSLDKPKHSSAAADACSSGTGEYSASIHVPTHTHPLITPTLPPTHTCPFWQSPCRLEASWS
mgnify:CR=1 FL=1